MGKTGVGGALKNFTQQGNTSRGALANIYDPFQLTGGGGNAPGSNYTPWNGIGGIEAAAGATAPIYQSLRDVNGNLQDKYKYDPFSGAASKQLQTEAMSTGPSQWAQNALAKQKFEEGQAGNRAGLQQQSAQSGAEANLARFGGIGSGARTSLARSGASDLLNAKQGVGAQGIEQRYGINDVDTQRRQQLLGQASGLEQQGQLQNLGTLTGDIAGQSNFNMDRYKQIMAAYGANQTANATAAAGAKSGGGKK